MPFPTVYALMAVAMSVGIGATLLAPEPPPVERPPRTFRDAVVEPLADYFARVDAVTILLFIVLYKVGDTMAGAMTTPFYLDVGFTKTEIGAVVNLFGYWATLGGLFAGGALLLRLGLFRSLWVFGLLQAASTAGFPFLSLVGPKASALAAVVAFENLTAGMGTAAFTAFMASLTNRRFTATQYALLSSLMGVPRVLFAAPTGVLAARTGSFAFFLFCAAAAAPGLALLLRFRTWMAERSREARS